MLVNCAKEKNAVPFETVLNTMETKQAQFFIPLAFIVLLCQKVMLSKPLNSFPISGAITAINCIERGTSVISGPIQ